MRKTIALILAAAMIALTACTDGEGETTAPVAETTCKELTGPIVQIDLNGDSVIVDGQPLEEGVALSGVDISRDIVYYENRAAYESGNPYGEGMEEDMHTSEEAGAHLVVNITQPGNYCVSGKLELGQIRVDLGEGAYADPNAVVNLILNSVNITCTVAPAILFENVYECDGNWSVETAKPDVDTFAAGANLILAEDSDNTVRGSYVAKIYRDAEGEKKLCKQDGAIYSYMSMNVFGPGSLALYAENEGLDTELHLTIHGGNIRIRSGNDGINTNEDGVSVTTIRGGNVHIVAGLGEEGDGIDSNGYLVIRGGTVIASANPAADAGLDSDMGSYIHGGTVIALGSAMDWVESNSGQVTLNLQFAQMLSGALVLTQENGTLLFAYDPARDRAMGDTQRHYQGAIISSPAFQVGHSCFLWTGGTVAGSEVNGIFDCTGEISYQPGTRMGYTGTDVMQHPGGGMPGGPQLPGDMTPPEGFRPPEGDYTLPGGEIPSRPQDGVAPPEEGFSGPQQGIPNVIFCLQDQVNFFTGITSAAIYYGKE